MILSAQTIRELCKNHGMITPFCERTVRNGKTFGLSSAGYDVRVDLAISRVLRFERGRFALAATFEHFSMPDDVIAFVHDKSSWARKGLAVQNTVIEPGWRGYLTVELTNHGPQALHIYQGDPIAQIVFHRLDEGTNQPYGGKYQDQPRGPQPAIEEPALETA